jgi:spermidine/putrescine transport system substrate-binding protein
MGWGGNFGEAVQRTIVEPFNEEHDTTVEYVPLPSPADMLAKLEAGSLGVDLVSHWNYTLYQGVKRDLFQPIREENVPNMGKIIDQYSPSEVSYDPGDGIHHVPNTIGGNGLVYNHDEMEEPSSWEDIFTDEYRNAVALPGWTTAAVGIGAKAAGLGLGTSLADNIDQVWNKLEGWNGYMYDWWGSGQDMQNYLQQESAYAGMLWYARVNALQENQDVPVSYTVPEEGTSMYVETYSIPKGVEGQKRRTAEYFLNYAYSEERIKDLVKEMPYTVPYNFEELPSVYEDHPEYEYLGTDRLEPWNSKVLENNRQDWSTKFRQISSGG